MKISLKEIDNIVDMYCIVGQPSYILSNRHPCILCVQDLD